MNQILRNVVVLVQGLQFIENGERFSPKDERQLTGNSNNGSNHILGFTSFGVDDFQSADKRKTSIFKWLEQKRVTNNPNMIFPNVEMIAQLMNDCYNELRKKYLPQLSIERHMVMFQSKSSNKRSLVLQIYLLRCISCHHYKKQCHCGLINQFGSCI